MINKMRCNRCKSKIHIIQIRKMKKKNKKVHQKFSLQIIHQRKSIIINVANMQPHQIQLINISFIYIWLYLKYEIYYII